MPGTLGLPTLVPDLMTAMGGSPIPSASVATPLPQRKPVVLISPVPPPITGPALMTTMLESILRSRGASVIVLETGADSIAPRPWWQRAWRRAPRIAAAMVGLG